MEGGGRCGAARALWERKFSLAVGRSAASRRRGALNAASGCRGPLLPNGAATSRRTALALLRAREVAERGGRKRWPAVRPGGWRGTLLRPSRRLSPGFVCGGGRRVKGGFWGRRAAGTRVKPGQSANFGRCRARQPRIVGCNHPGQSPRIGVPARGAPHGARLTAISALRPTSCTSSTGARATRHDWLRKHCCKTRSVQGRWGPPAAEIGVGGGSRACGQASGGGGGGAHT